MNRERFKLNVKVGDKNIQRNFYDIVDKINELQSFINSTTGITAEHTHKRADIADFWNAPFWSNIPDKPASYPPASHTHNRNDITNLWAEPFWNNIPDKPSTYPPSAHQHNRSEIVDFWNTPFWNSIPDKPSTFPPSAHTHERSDITNFWSSPFWNSIPDKPSTFPPSSHSHNRSDITDFWNTPFWNNIPDKPSTYPPSSHTHSKSDITGLPWAWNEVSKSGSNLTDIETRPHSALQNIGAFDHHGDHAHKGLIATIAPTGASERAYVDSNNLYVHDGSSWVLRATKDWNNLINKPSTFPPSAHTHGRSDITNFWSSPFWDNIPDKPSTFPPSTHSHNRSEITDFWSTPFWNNIPDKPSTYPPSAHQHNRNDITDFWAEPFWNNIPDKPFKIVPPGTNTLSQAVASMNSGDVLVLCKGTYTQTESVVIPPGIQRFAIIGQGRGITILDFTNAVDGIKSQTGSDTYRITKALIRGFTMKMSVASTNKTAIYLWGHVENGYVNPGITIEEISIERTDWNKYWEKGIQVDNAENLYIKNCFFRGYNDSVTGNRFGKAIILRSCIVPKIIGGAFVEVYSGIELAKADDGLIFGSNKHGTEGATIFGVDVYICNYGILCWDKCLNTQIIQCTLAVCKIRAFEEAIETADGGGYHTILGGWADMDTTWAIDGSSVIRFCRPGSVLKGMIINGSISPGHSINGVQLINYATNCVINNNVVRYTITGIWSLTNGNVINSNRVEGNSYSILLWSSANNNVVVGNSVNQSITDNGTNNEVAHNVIF